MKHTFKCPLCKDDDPIVRGSLEHLEMAVASHILTAHEERAALQAVDKARVACSHIGCEIGRKNHLMLTGGTAMLNLSDFDKTWLSAMKIYPE